MIDMTGDSDSEDNAECSSRYPRSDVGANPMRADHIGPQPSPYGKRPPRAYQLSTSANGIDSEQSEIPESPSTIQACPAVSDPCHRLKDPDRRSELAAITAVTEPVATYTEDSGVGEQQGQEKEEQQREGTNNDGRTFPPSRQPKAPVPTFTVRVLESSLVSARRGQENVQAYRRRTQTAGLMSPAGEVACTESRSCIDIQDITFLRVEGQREAADGPEYQFVAKVWLPPGVGIPSDLVHVYRRDVARQARLSTLRTRKRISEEAGVVKVKRCTARKKVKQA